MPQRRSSIRGREFGDAIRALLNQAGITGRAMAERAGWDGSKLSDLINGKGGTNEVELALLLGLLGTGPDEFEHLMKLYRYTQERDWLQPTGQGMSVRSRTMRDNETKASTIIGWSMNIVHGLLQARDYAWHVGKAALRVSDDDLPKYVEYRAERQKRVLDGRREVTIFMQESALRLPVGDPAVMSIQMHHLLQVTVRPYLTLRVVPTAAGLHGGIAGSFDLLRFKKLPPIACTETEGAIVFLEDEVSVSLYDDVVKSLDRTALDEEQTRRLIINIIDEEARGGEVAQE